MANETYMTIVGNVTEDPVLRFTQSGTPVANLTIASTPRSFDKASGEWKDGTAMFMRCSIWRRAAQNVTDSITKGMRVIASGRVGQRNFQDKEGNNRSSIEMTIDEIGPSLTFATAQVTKNRPSGGAQPPGNTPIPGDPWGGEQFSDENPPF